MNYVAMSGVEISGNTEFTHNPTLDRLRESNIDRRDKRKKYVVDGPVRGKECMHTCIFM